MLRTLPDKKKLPHALYRAAQVREFDRTAIEDFSIPSLTLMERAGEAAFRLLLRLWPEACDITVLCGVGNNGGDGYVVARLAIEHGLSVHVLQLGESSRIQGDALASADAYLSSGGEISPYEGLPRKCELIVDAVFGTGLEREVIGAWREALEAVNRHPAPVLALDIPSGLNSDTGAVLGVAVEASATISFIGLKQGMFTAEGPRFCGEVVFDALQLPAVIYSKEIIAARRIDWQQQASRLSPRSRTAHKGDFGHVLVIGGELGYAGAALMAAEAAARSGAGLVSVATRLSHAAQFSARRPELMCHGVEQTEALTPLLQKATVVAIGPGLAQTSWSMAMFDRVLQSNLPLVVDADALNLLAAEPMQRDNWVITPHPGEAARLLRISSRQIQQNRFQAAADLQRRYGGVVVLKGAGTLVVGASERPPAVCSEGNPGMASGGMGDLLTGIIASLVAQGEDMEDAASMGVCLHGAAADLAAREGERGMLAEDLMPGIRTLLNPEIA